MGFKFIIRSPEATRREELINQQLEEQIEQKKRENEFYGSLPGYLESNQALLEPTTSIKTVPDWENVVPMLGEPVGSMMPGEKQETITTPAKETWNTLVGKYAMQKGLAREGLGLLNQDRVERANAAKEARLEKEKRIHQKLTLWNPMLKTVAENGDNDGWQKIITAMKKDEDLHDHVKNFDGTTVTAKGEVTAVMDVGENELQNPINGKFEKAGTYEVKTKNGRVVGIKPMEEKPDSNRAIGHLPNGDPVVIGKDGQQYGIGTDGKKYVVRSTVISPLVTEKASGSGSGKAEKDPMAKVGTADAVKKMVNQGFMKMLLDSGKLDKNTSIEEIRSGVLTNPYNYLNQSQSQAYDMILEKAQSLSATEDSPAKAYQMALKWFHSLTWKDGKYYLPSGESLSQPSKTIKGTNGTPEGQFSINRNAKLPEKYTTRQPEQPAVQPQQQAQQGGVPDMETRKAFLKAAGWNGSGMPTPEQKRKASALARQKGYTL